MIEFLKLAPLELRTASGQIDNLKTAQPGQALGPSNPNAKCYLTVTTQSGTTPTLDVAIVKIIDGVINVLGTFAQVTTTVGGSTPIDISNMPDDVTVFWAMGGTNPEYTFSVWLSR